MLKYIAKRLAYAVLVLLGVSLIMYFLVRLMPVDFIQSKIDAMNQGGATVETSTQIAMYDTYGLEYPDTLIESKISELKTAGASAEEIAEWEDQLGGASGWGKVKKLFKGYFTWLGNLARLDLGVSFKYGIPVEDKIAMHKAPPLISWRQIRSPKYVPGGRSRGSAQRGWAWKRSSEH